MKQRKNYSETNRAFIAEFSEVRRLFFVLLYFMIAAVAFYFLYRFLYRDKLFFGILIMFKSGEKSLVENFVLILLLLTIPAFISLMYNALSLFTLCIRIDKNKCYIKSEGKTLIFSSPVIDKGWRVVYNRDSVVLSPDNVVKVKSKDESQEQVLVPVRKIFIYFRDGSIITIDAMFFKGWISEVENRILTVIFPELIEEKIGYREGESVLDEYGHFIPPGKSNFPE